MKNKRDINNFSDLAETFFVQNRCTYIESVCSSDCNCKRSNTCTLYEFFCFLRICVGVCLCFKIIFLAADFAKLCLTWDVQRFCHICHTLCLCNVCFKIQLGAVDHNRSISSMHCLHSQFKAAAVIQMKAYRNRCFGSLSCNDCCISLYRAIFACGWSCLDHYRCFQFFCSLDDCFDHLHILRIKSSYCVSAFLCL